MSVVVLRIMDVLNVSSLTGSLDLAKQGLADIQLRSMEHSMHHPKLQTTASIVNTWRTSIRRDTKEKVYLGKHLGLGLCNSPMFVKQKCLYIHVLAMLMGSPSPIYVYYC